MTQEVPEGLVDQLTGPRKPTLRVVAGGMTPEAALDVLFRRHYASLVRLAAAMTGSREAAEDAVQDAFASLFRHWRQLRDPKAADAYLRSAVLNRCRSDIRGRIRDRALADLRVVAPVVTGNDEAVLLQQDAGLVAGALRRLPRRQREVLACRYLLELTVSETADTLGISGGAVKRHTHRGLQALHTALEGSR